MPLCNDIIKNRQIRFRLSTASQAKKAEQLLVGVAGIEHVEAVAANSLQIRYSVEELTLNMIESALREVGFELDDSLIIRFKRAVFSYCEDALRASIGVEEASGEARAALSLPEHSLQDPRPDDWRKYI